MALSKNTLCFRLESLSVTELYTVAGKKTAAEFSLNNFNTFKCIFTIHGSLHIIPRVHFTKNT